jgi:hypothetical protein
MKLFGIRDAERVADLIAIPFFLLALLYLLQKRNKTLIEWILLLFVYVGFVLDTIFTLDFLNVIGDCEQ